MLDGPEIGLLSFFVIFLCLLALLGTAGACIRLIPPRRLLADSSPATAVLVVRHPAGEHSLGIKAASAWR